MATPKQRLERLRPVRLLKNLYPDSYFKVERKEMTKIVLVVPNKIRTFIYQNSDKLIKEGKADLATNFLHNYDWERMRHGL